MLRIRLSNKRTLAVNYPKVAGLTLLTLGIVGLLLSTAYSSSISAFISLGLVFWGIILTYVQSDEFVKVSVIDATAIPLLTTLNQTLRELDYRGKAVYLPPKYLTSPEATKAFIPRQETDRLPQPDQTQRLENLASNRNAQGMLITPPGAELTKLFEAALGTNLIKTNLDDLQRDLPKLLIEDLEIATDVEITPGTDQNESADNAEVKQNRIHVRITSRAYRNTSKQATQLPAIFANIGCPLTSAIACSLAKTTGKPITIENQQTSEDGQTTETVYRILEEEQ